MNVTTIFYAIIVVALLGLGYGLYHHGETVCGLKDQKKTDQIFIDKGDENEQILANRPDFVAFTDGVLDGGAY